MRNSGRGETPAGRGALEPVCAVPGSCIDPGLSTLLRLRELEKQRSSIVAWLINERGFSAKGAAACADNFLATMRYVGDQTGELFDSSQDSPEVAPEPIEPPPPRKECPWCNGKGEVRAPIGKPSGPVVCPDCRGRGYVVAATDEAAEETTHTQSSEQNLG